MPESLPEYLKKRAVRSFHYLLREVDSVSAEKALRFVTPDWPPHKFGIGQNGSIAGIVYHVAAWKVLTLPLFEPDGAMIPIANFDYRAAPKPNDWPGIAAWLREVGETWNTRLLALPDAAFDDTRDWDGPTLTLAEYIAEMLEHDIQHASQIEYLRQRLRVEALQQENRE